MVIICDRVLVEFNVVVGNIVYDVAYINVLRCEDQFEGIRQVVHIDLDAEERARGSCWKYTVACEESTDFSCPSRVVDVQSTVGNWCCFSLPFCGGSSINRRTKIYGARFNVGIVTVDCEVVACKF